MHRAPHTYASADDAATGAPAGSIMRLVRPTQPTSLTSDPPPAAIPPQPTPTDPTTYLVTGSAGPTPKIWSAARKQEGKGHADRDYPQYHAILLDSHGKVLDVEARTVKNPANYKPRKELTDPDQLMPFNGLVGYLTREEWNKAYKEWVKMGCPAPIAGATQQLGSGKSGP